jgi:hypothetical protein
MAGKNNSLIDDSNSGDGSSEDDAWNFDSTTNSWVTRRKKRLETYELEIFRSEGMYHHIH